MKFNPIKYRTTCCNDVLYSRFPGEFRHCHCKKVAVDQTEHYQRFIGGAQYLVPIDEEQDEESNER